MWSRASARSDGLKPVPTSNASRLYVAIDHVDHFVARERLAHPGVRAGAGEHLFERFLRQIGDQDDGNVLFVGLRFEDFAEAVAFDAGEIDIEKDDVRRIPREDVIELDPTRGGQDRATLSLEQGAAELEH